jgi:hypothetical protein
MACGCCTGKTRRIHKGRAPASTGRWSAAKSCLTQSAAIGSELSVARTVESTNQNRRAAAPDPPGVDRILARRTPGSFPIAASANKLSSGSEVSTETTGAWGSRGPDKVRKPFLALGGNGIAYDDCIKVAGSEVFDCLQRRNCDQPGIRADRQNDRQRRMHRPIGAKLLWGCELGDAVPWFCQVVASQAANLWQGSYSHGQLVRDSVLEARIELAEPSPSPGEPVQLT